MRCRKKKSHAFLTRVSLIGVALLAVKCQAFATNSEIENFPAAQLISKGEVSVEGRIQLDRKRESQGPLIYAGNKINVKAGEAKLELLSGGMMRLLKNTELTILENHPPYLFSISKGTLSFDLKSNGDNIFTPDFLIKTISEPFKGPIKVKGEMSLKPGGVLCLFAQSGALQVATQDNQTLLVIPAGHSMELHPGGPLGQPQFLSQSCGCLDSAKFRPEDFQLSFASRPRSFWGRTAMALRRAFHLITLGLI
jgi:hypothetical protein